MSEVQDTSTDAAEQRAIERIAVRAGWRPTDAARAAELGVKPFMVKEGDDPSAFSAEHYLSKRYVDPQTQRRLQDKAGQVDILAGKLARIESQLTKAQRTELGDRMDAAMEANDKDGARRILQEAEKLTNESGNDEGIADTKLDAEVGDDFRSRNEWFGTHVKATKAAQDLFKELGEEKGASRWGRERYERAYADVERKVKARFPSLADEGETEPESDEKPERKPPPQVGRGAASGRRTDDGNLSPQTMNADQQRAAEQTYVKKPGYTLDDHKKRYCEIVNESRA